MTLRELLAHLRCSVLRDTASPTLWSDAEFKAFLNEAQANFARRTFCLSTDSEPFTTFDTEVGRQSYPLDPRVLRIDELGILDPNDGRWIPLRPGTRGQVPRTHVRGRPMHYTADAVRHTIRLAPIPDDVFTVEMVVRHLPLVPMSDPDDECSVDEDYQLALCDYAAWRALKNNSPEGAQMVPAGDFRAAYELHVRDAKRDLANLHRGEFAQARNNWTGKSYRGR